MIYVIIDNMKNKHMGFTLMEVILYLAIAGTVLYFIGGFAFNAIFGKSKIEAYQDINTNLEAVMNDLKDVISDAESVYGGCIYDEVTMDCLEDEEE